MPIVQPKIEPSSIPVEFNLDEPPQSYSELMGGTLWLMVLVGFVAASLSVAVFAGSLNSDSSNDSSVFLSIFVPSVLASCIGLIKSRNLRKPRWTSHIQIDAFNIKITSNDADGVRTIANIKREDVEGVTLREYRRVALRPWDFANNYPLYEYISVVELSQRGGVSNIPISWRSTDSVNFNYGWNSPESRDQLLKPWSTLLQVPMLGSSRVDRQLRPLVHLWAAIVRKKSDPH